ncbi:hypothetical protein [Roseomonas sp. BN140053]|uniref:hypothetical protein n=1 Tax=Roseomonas sp. BN140053 TaxID=3391898 RepID=UPI0039EB26F1
MPEPRPEAAPSAAHLRGATLLSLLAALLLLLAVVLPAERGLDPLGTGRLLGLTAMGEEKAALDAAAARHAARLPELDQVTARLAAVEAQLRRLQPLVDLATPPAANSPAVLSDGSQPAAQPAHETVLTLAPGGRARVQLEMRRGARADYVWNAAGGAVNVEMEGERLGSTRGAFPRGATRAQAEADEGRLIATADGYQGWSWLNRSGAPVTITLRTSGEYRGIRLPDRDAENGAG